MSEKAFRKMMRGLKAYMEGDRKGCKVTLPVSVNDAAMGKSRPLDGARWRGAESCREVVTLRPA